MTSAEDSEFCSTWEFNSFGLPLKVLQFNPKIPIPTIQKPDQLLVQVHSASINPIDVGFTQGYGSELARILREKAKGRYMASIWWSPGEEFPITLGRDFSGVVKAVGSEVTDFKVGQEVYGVVHISLKGSHADYVVVDQTWIQPKPSFLSFSEAAAIPYVALTTWSALNKSGGFTDFNGKSFLVLGGSGGVGTFAIQYLKSQGAQVTTTCSPSSNSLLSDLGADFLIDYKDPELDKKIESHGPYDGIFDTVGPLGGGDKTIQYGHKGSGKYITIRTPGSANMKSYGVVLGALKSGLDLFTTNMYSRYYYGVAVKWGFFTPDGVAWKGIHDMVMAKKIKPVVEKVYTNKDLPNAYEKVREKHVKGKVVVDIINKS